HREPAVIGYQDSAVRTRRRCLPSSLSWPSSHRSNPTMLSSRKWSPLGTLLAVALAGCGSASNLGAGTGTLTYKGKPGTNAYVDFNAEHGRPSWGQTDEQGRFTLEFDRKHKGALLGKHKVSVRMKPTTVAEQEAVMEGRQPPISREMKEFFDKYSAERSNKEVTIDKKTREVKLERD